MKILKAFVVMSAFLSFHAIASVYTCNIVATWDLDDSGEHRDRKYLGSMTVDTQKDLSSFPIEQSQLAFFCGGIHEEKSSEFAKRLDINVGDGGTSWLACALVDLTKQDHVIYKSHALTEEGAKLVLATRVADNSLPTKAKTLVSNCFLQGQG